MYSTTNNMNWLCPECGTSACGHSIMKKLRWSAMVSHALSTRQMVKRPLGVSCVSKQCGDTLNETLGVSKSIGVLCGNHFWTQTIIWCLSSKRGECKLLSPTHGNSGRSGDSRYNQRNRESLLRSLCCYSY